MNGGTISGNSGSYYGGGVEVVGGGTTFDMSGGSISGNTASGYGGGVRVSNGDNITFDMSGGSISGNTATGNSAQGGGVYVSASGYTFTMSGGSISGNTATGNSAQGGGVYVSGTNSLSSFSMSNSAMIHTSNAVSLNSGAIITLSGTLTADPVANIEYPTATGSQVLGGNDIITGGNYKKFLLDYKSNENGDMIDMNGTIK
jgi:hypothetical protein